MLITHGHKKEDILSSYSREEIGIFYEKCAQYDRRQDANMIKDVLAGIGGSFGGSKNIIKLIEKMSE